MNANRQRGNWVLDTLLLGGFILAMLLDFTGLDVHQWLGIVVPVVAGYHLARHWQWVVAVSRRVFRGAGATPAAGGGAAARRNLAVDAALLIGLAAIAVTGLVISSWLKLSLTNYAGWLTVHIVASLATLVVLVVKIGLHWRWIVSTARRYVFAAPRMPNPAALAPALAVAPVAARSGRVTRRDFLGLMTAVGAVSLLAGSKALSGVVQAAGSAATEATNTAAGARTGSTGTTASCTVACGRRCSYPGQCRRYADTNGNGKCDLGECGSGGTAVGGSGAGEFNRGFEGGRPAFRGRGGRG